MVNISSSLKKWFYRRHTAEQKAKGNRGSGCDDYSSVDHDRHGKGLDSRKGCPMGLQSQKSSAFSSSHSGVPMLVASDWLIGWYEPLAPGFDTDDSFAVLVPCYESPSPSSTDPNASSDPSSSQHWASLLKKVALETEIQSDAEKDSSQ
ncbi:hypothetical protein KP509_07G085900 [Ceratopteris richardii]|uniref:Uncharacterized protein n=1 Tax=Ceratopteris richardii TaxID=49495 RepID=A0A8T2UNC9_CERRI|nr:hypothetical protein KP509_07G085900 [Ceratopteris richardii]